MDVRMPGIDGIETTRRLKARYPTLGVVALSGHEDQEIVTGHARGRRERLRAEGLRRRRDPRTPSSRPPVAGGPFPGVTPRVIDELTEALERERRRTRELEEAQAALVERAARRHELVARLSHELRTPVTVILGMAQTLAKSARGAAARELLERLVDSAHAISRGSSSGSSSRSTPG